MLKYLITLLPLVGFALAHNSTLIVKTLTGDVRGKLNTYNGLEFVSFKGIPYAEPPIGELRFKAPVPKKRWDGIRDAFEHGPICMQNITIEEDISEDCLSLHIYVPVTNNTERLSVLFWVHGGEFRYGSAYESTNGPQYFLEKDVILVTVNHRLGVLGFLALGIEAAPGNAGLKDVRLGLKWIKENIEYFGGDPERITIAGQSAGSAIIHYMLLSETTTGLFNRAILQSGSALSYRFFTDRNIQTAFTLGRQLGFNSTSAIELYELLRDKPFNEINDALLTLENDDARGAFRPYALFVPVVEDEKWEGYFINRSPKEITKEGIPQNVPIMVGFNEKEGLIRLTYMLSNPNKVEYLNQNYELIVPDDLRLEDSSHQKKNIGNMIKKFYFGSNQIDNSTVDEYCDLITDTMYSYTTDKWIRNHAEHKNHSAVYYYFFKFDDQLNAFKLKDKLTNYQGAAHCDELGYLFLSEFTEPILQNLTESAATKRRIMVDLWTNFIKFGHPSSTELNGVDWKPITGSSIKYFSLDEEPRMYKGSPFPERVQFWIDLYRYIFTNYYY